MILLYLLYFLGPEFGTTRAAWQGVLTEADRLSETHLDIKKNLMEGLHVKVRNWQKDNYHKVSSI